MKEQEIKFKIAKEIAGRQLTKQGINDSTDAIYEILKEQLRLCGVGNCADLNPPHFKQKKMNEKAEKAKHLKNIGYSIREIMSIMNYKSPKSIQDLLKR